MEAEPEYQIPQRIFVLLKYQDFVLLKYEDFVLLKHQQKLCGTAMFSNCVPGKGATNLGSDWQFRV